MPESGVWPCHGHVDHIACVYTIVKRSMGGVV